MGDGHFVTVTVVSKPLAQSVKKELSVQPRRENKVKNQCLAQSKESALQRFDSDTDGTRKLYCLSKEFCFASSI